MSAHECFERYERRYARAMASLPELRPWLDADRERIVSAIRKCLGVKEEWIPSVAVETVRTTVHDRFCIEHLRSTSWPGVRGTALLYLPEPTAGPQGPFVLLCCGHGPHGKLSLGYQAMARHLVRLGAIVLVPDNIGQGERTAMGHRDAVGPFACGSSVQGLIVTETLGWVNWAATDPRIDASRMAAVGNSGGGHLTTFLSALCPQLAVLSSSGHPSSFDFVARKEKELCHCTLVPFVVGELEMWHLYGCFAPKPMFLFQGNGDPLFPPDIFYNVARKVRHVYAQCGASEAFSCAVMDGSHSWDSGRRVALGAFLSRTLELRRTSEQDLAAEDEPDIFTPDQGCYDRWPADAITIEQLAVRLTGKQVRADLRLGDVFPPDAQADELDEAATIRGSTREILAQFEASLKVDPS